MKEEIKDINDRLENGSISDEEAKMEYEVWLRNVYLVRDTFGDAAVPDDIKHAANTVEENIDVAVTQWVVPYDRALFNQ